VSDGVREPRVDRPYMPSYGVLAPDEGQGLLPWSQVEARLAKSHDYWLASTWPDGRPHIMPVWGVLLDASVWFSTSLQSRKWKNLARDPRCTVTSDDAYHPVIIEGSVEVRRDTPSIQRFLDALNAKYETSYGLDFQDPDVNATIRVVARTVFSLDEDDFTGTPTRWTFT
jgi:PPOX class probable F420-dependent enzyme